MIEGASARKPLLPPAYFLGSLLLMAALGFALPIASLLSWPWRATGILPIAAGALLNLAADRAFKDLGTTVKPFERSSALATSGVFRLSRNPMYLGMALILIGAAMLLGLLTPFLVAAGFIVVIETRFIPVEERMLAERFGDAWAAYRQRTRRWI
jgi:protein-S-isoprenylcysteine O-methyltransferase Ste14